MCCCFVWQSVLVLLFCSEVCSKGYPLELGKLDVFWKRDLLVLLICLDPTWKIQFILWCLQKKGKQLLETKVIFDRHIPMLDHHHHLLRPGVELGALKKGVIVFPLPLDDNIITGTNLERVVLRLVYVCRRSCLLKTSGRKRISVVF